MSRDRFSRPKPRLSPGRVNELRPCPIVDCDGSLFVGSTTSRDSDLGSQSRVECDRVPAFLWHSIGGSRCQHRRRQCNHVPFSPPGGRRYYIVVQAYNSAGGLSAKSAEVIYDAPATQNQPPVLTQPANQSSTQNTSQSLALVASDPEGTALTFGASGLPPGLALNTSTGVIAGTVSTAGTYSVTATASDGSLTASRTFTWTVTAATGATTLNLSPTDTTININSTNYVSDQLLYTYTYPANRVANAILMKFDLSQLPANATIQSATLQLSLMNADNVTTDPNYSVSLHQVINRNPDLTRATGSTADGVADWTANSCCYQNIPMAQSDISPARAVTAVNRTLGVKTWDALSIVQAWRTAPSTNYGLLLNSDTTKGTDRYRFFASMENPSASQRRRCGSSIPSPRRPATPRRRRSP